MHGKSYSKIEEKIDKTDQHLAVSASSNIEPSMKSLLMQF